MSDEHDDKHDDPAIEAPAASNQQPTTGRRTEPPQLGARSDDDVPEDCIAAARHVANCPRCMTALRAHIDKTIATLLNATDGHKSH